MKNTDYVLRLAFFPQGRSLYIASPYRGIRGGLFFILHLIRDYLFQRAAPALFFTMSLSLFL